MDNGLFLDGYSEPAAHIRRRQEEDPTAHELMEGARKWASVFDRQLVLYLKGEKPSDPQALHNSFGDYYFNWLTPHLDDTIRAGEKNSRTINEKADVTNELNFHVLNRELFPMWYHLLFSEQMPGYDEKLLHGMQTRLAYTGALLSAQRKATITKNDRPALYRLHGRMTEVDTAIVLLEMVKKCLKGSDGKPIPSQLIVLPAPPRFESGYHNHSHAADFIILDPAQRQAHGIQVKTTMDHPRVLHRNEQTLIDRYSLDYVSLVDGETDLGNSRPDLKPPYHEPLPGLISLEYLRDHVNFKDAERNDALSGFRSEILRGKSIARELAKNNKPYLNTATRHIGSRVLHDLYKQKNSPIESVSL